jgi:hypothetical protein
MEVIIEQENVNETLNILQLYRKVRLMALDEMKIGTTYDDLYGTINKIVEEMDPIT